MDIEAIRDRVVFIEGYGSLKREVLCGELERYRQSLEWIDPKPNGSLLDLGSCGELVPVYQGLLGYRRVVCLDTAGATGRQRLVHRDGSVCEFDAHDVNLERKSFPFPDARFDQVVAMEVLEHLAVDPMFMLAEANRVLKPGGRLLLTTPNVTSLASLYLLLWGRHPSTGRQAYGPGTMDRHHREYAPQEVRDVLVAAGFEVRQLDTFDPSPPNRSLRRIGQLLKLLRWFKPELSVECRSRVIRCVGVKVGEVVERFPEVLYPRYAYYDYGAYDRELERRLGRRYWHTNVRSVEPEKRASPPVRPPADTAAAQPASI